tara:strand:- start:63 stop:1418 length:1356 start_codon:yes stop_codon:yes gene_type:complete
MATHDYDIANQSGANFRADLNNCLDAIVSNNSSGSEPATKFAYMWWVDTSNDILKIRNSANNAWIDLPMSITTSNTISPTLNMGTGAAEDVKIVFDGNAQDYYIGLDDSADDLIIGKGSTVGTTAALVIDENLNVGIGTTSPDFLLDVEGSNTQVKVGAASQDGGFLTSTDNNQLIVSGGFYFDGSNFIATSTSASGVSFDNGTAAFFNNTSLTDGNSFTLTESMRIDSSGVGVGTTSLDSHKMAIDSGAGTSLGLMHKSSNAFTLMTFKASGTTQDIRIGATGNDMIFQTVGTERVRVDSSGLMQMGTTGKTGRINLQPNPANNHFMEFYSTVDSKVGEINTSTGVQTNYVTSSDYRLKENIVPMEKGLERVNKLKPVKFNWKNDETISEGFIAHEVQEAGWNEGVIGEKDSEEMQMVDYGKLTPLLVKAIQEQQEQIEELKKEIETLKN